MATDPPVDYEQLFDTLPERYIVFANDVPDFTMVGANQAYLDVTNKKRSEIVGKRLFDVFPDTSPLAIKTGKGELYRSLERCLKTGKSDSMGVMRYDIPNGKGGLEVRYWQATHYPILEKDKVVGAYQSTTDVTEMVEASERVELSDRQLEEALSEGHIGAWNWDIKRDTVFADKGLARIFNMSEQKAKEGLTLNFFTSHIHKDDRDRVQAEIQAILEKGTRFQSEYRTIDTEGRERWVIARGRVQRNKAGEPVSLPGIMIDITDRKAAEEALSESENRLRFMADSVPQLVWVAGANGDREFYNDQWYEYTGTKPGTFEGKGWEKLYLHADYKHTSKAWQKSLKTGEPFEIEFRLYHAPSKSYRWVIGRALPFRDDKGKITKWYGTCTDIDDRKRATDAQAFLSQVSKELSSSLNYNASLKKISKLCIPTLADWCSIDLYDEKTGFNQVSVAHKDPKKISTAKEFRRHNPIDIDMPGGVPQVVRTGKPEFYPYIDEKLIRASVPEPDVLDFMLKLDLRSIIIVPIKVNDKSVGAITFVASESGRYYTEDDFETASELAARVSLHITNAHLYQDLKKQLDKQTVLEAELLVEKEKLESRVRERTEQLQLTNQGLRDEILKRKAVEQELQDHSDDLARSNRELEDFAYIASHDLQEPLRKIQAFSNLLKTEYGAKLGEGSDYVDRMTSAANRMSTLIQDLLSFSRVSTKANPHRVVDLNVVVKEVITDLEASIQDAEATIAVKHLPNVIADPTHMRQLFQNLIGNALKFRKPNQPALVKVSSKLIPGGKVEIKVRDEGIGFDQKYTDKIFAVFQRLHGKEQFEGTGIGLAVCRKIVEQYGGTITAESEKNNGATFIIRMPRTAGEKA